MIDPEAEKEPGTIMLSNFLASNSTKKYKDRRWQMRKPEVSCLSCSTTAESTRA